MVGAAVGLAAVAASGIVADRIGRRTLLGVSAVMIGAYSGFAPQLLGRGPAGEWIYMLLGFVLLGFTHPATGQRMHFRAEIPPEFRPWLPPALRNG